MSGPRKYQVGNEIPGRGTVTQVTLTAYLTDDPIVGVVPFYGPAGVDDAPAWVEPLVRFG